MAVPDPAPPRILLVRLSAIGDVIHALFGLAALRAAQPAAHIGFLVEDRAASIVEGHPDLDRVHVYPRRRWQSGLLRDPLHTAQDATRFLADLRSARYDVAVDLQGNLKSGLLATLSGAPRRIGLSSRHAKEMSHLLHTERVEVPAGPLHRVDRALRLLSPLGVSGPAGSPRIAVRDDDRAEISGWLRAEGLVDGTFALLHPGTSGFGKHKRWEASRFGALAATLRRTRGLSSVVTWGPGEEGLADLVVAASGGAARRGPRTKRLTALAGLMERAALFVAADTGALHLAALLGVPVAGLFGPKDPRIYGPRGARVRVVHKGVDCSPCPKRSCADPVCMTSITVEDVLMAVDALLAQGVPAHQGG
jgi:ADP-heptose:LPS heptosyltransferase